MAILSLWLGLAFIGALVVIAGYRETVKELRRWLDGARRGSQTYEADRDRLMKLIFAAGLMVQEPVEPAKPTAKLVKRPKPKKGMRGFVSQFGPMGYTGYQGY